VIRTARSALGLLREGLWLRLLIAVAVLSVAFVYLGRWQYHRHEAKVARRDVIAANYDAAPVALAQVLPDPSTVLPASGQWTSVEVTGVYEPGGQVLIRNRPLDGQYGYEVVVPLRTASGAALLVDRGWLPPGEDFVRPASVPAPPGGTVTVVVRLRPGEPPIDTQPPLSQQLRIDLARIAAVAGGEVYRGAYGVLASEQPVATPSPTLLERPDDGLGPHFAYAFQWWFGAVAAWGLLGYYAVREVSQRAEVGGGVPHPGVPVPSRPEHPSRPERPSRPPRKRPMTDEEYEDAASAG
jgi:cytochrome oxidase assembly protein ShyY1